MACYHPIPAYRARYAGPNGKRGIVFKAKDSNGTMLEVPCGQCIGCRLQRSKDWAVRMMHEAQMHEDNAFITLTYDNEHLPADGSLNKEHFQDFMKRMRARLAPTRIRFFHCGEYGEKFARPHYHAIIFGYGFPDRTLYKDTGETKLYTSAFLADCWGHGFTTVGDVTFDSAAYVARYVVKKITGEKADDHYWKVNEETGEIHRIEPEYTTMSRNPGIASSWYDKWGDEVFPADSVIQNGHEIKPPRYYDKLFEEHHGDLDAIKRERARKGEKHKKDQTWRRLLDRERCHERKAQLLKRGFENES